MKVREWVRDRQELIAELRETREQTAEVGRMLAEAVKERDQAFDRLDDEERRHEKTQHVLESFEAALDGDDVFAPPTPRTPAEELALAPAHAVALERRVHELQQANMAADRPRM